MAVLHLTLKKKWFDMILSGEKTEEYRELKPYWITRLFGWSFGSYSSELTIAYMMNGFELKKHNKRIAIPDYEIVVFRNGYATNAPIITIECLGIEIGKARPEWSDNWQRNVFVIKLGKIISTTNIMAVLPKN